MLTDNKEYCNDQSSCFIEINIKAWEHNIISYKNMLPHGVQLGVVLKSNAYGHGLDRMAHLANHNHHIDWLLLASCREAVQLAISGIKKNMLVLSILDEYLEQALVQGCSVVVYSKESALRIVHYANLNSLIVSVHVKIDTGLSRLGVSMHDAPLFVHWLNTFDCIRIAGIFTHFSDAQQKDHTFLHEQQQQLDTIFAYCSTISSHPILQHSACSAAIGRVAASHGNLVRLGIGAYGLWPSDQTKEHIQSLHPNFYLRSILFFKSTILQLKSIKAGCHVGYDKTFIAQKDMIIATLPVGYYDGLNRKLSNIGYVMINGQIAPIIGIISMNLTTVDVTHIKHVHLKSIVELIGDHQAISLETHAQKCGTITYDFVTQLGSHIVRQYC